MPMPLSWTAMSSSTASGPASRGASAHPDLAGGRELDGVVDEVAEDLADAARIADRRSLAGSGRSSVLSASPFA